jgi:hypothetical protein
LIAVIIFYLHTIFAVYAFCRSYQSDGLVQAFLNVGFIVVLFTVGWTLSDLIVGLIISEKGYNIFIPQNNIILTLLKLTGFYKPSGNGFANLYPKDAISLVVLSLIEIFFYRFYFKKTKLD